MLDELRVLAETLEKVGISGESLHRNYKPCRRANTYVVKLLPDGNASDICQLAGEYGIRLRRWAPDNFRSFPGFNMTTLLVTTDKKAVKLVADSISKSSSIKDAISEFDALINACKPGWGPNELNALRRHLKEANKDFASALGLGSDESEPEARFLFDLCQRAEAINPEHLIEQLISLVRRKIETDPILAAAMLQDMIASVFDTKGKLPQCQVYLDIQNDSFGDVDSSTSEALRIWTNQRLMRSNSEQQDTGSETRLPDAYGDETLSKEAEELMPELTLPVLGRVKLRSLNQDIPCQGRYGMIGPQSFRIGSFNRQKMQDSLSWLLRAEHEGITWKNISRQTEFKDAAVFCAYISDSDAGLSVKPVQIFSFDDDDESANVIGEKTLIAGAARVVATLEGLCREQPLAEIRSFVIARIDPGRTKLLWPRCLSVTQMFDRARNWQLASKNLPAQMVSGSIGESKAHAGGGTVSPSMVASVVNVLWLRGKDATKETETSFAAGLSLLLDSSTTQRLGSLRLLHKLILHAEPFFLRRMAELAVDAHGSRRGGGAGKRSQTNEQSNEYWKNAPNLLGILLWQMGRMRSDYVKGYAYLIGRLLSLTDLLHKEYANRDRQGKLPSRLLGNSSMTMAGKAPQKMMSLLSERLPLYQSWANTQKTNKLAIWTLNELGAVSKELKNHEIPAKMSDTDRAELLLGYLSRESLLGTNAGNNDA